MQTYLIFFKNRFVNILHKDIIFGSFSLFNNYIFASKLKTKKMKILKLIILAIILNGCGLHYMSSNYHKVNYDQTPSVLQTKGEMISINLKGTFPEKYFAKKATVEITPVIIGEDGKESKLKSIILQGEQATGGDETIFFESGGSFVYSDKIKYTDDMKSSLLELRAIAVLEDENKVLGPVTIAKGVISTSMKVANNEIIAIAHHGYEEETILSETATIYFLVNKSNIRTTEKSDADVKKLQEFIKLGYKTESFVVKSSASPEGKEKINTELSDDRQNNTFAYAKSLLKKLKADGANNDDNYKKSSAGADWDGFNKLVENSSIDEKNTILNLTDKTKQRSQKERGELLQDMAQVYDALEKDVLQFLRKSEITINSYQPKKTKSEILSLSLENPSKLTIEELLYSATLEENEKNKLVIYNIAIELHNDWRAYNNLAAYYLSNNDAKTAVELLNLAYENGGSEDPSVLTNLGIVASWNGSLSNAQDLFDRAKTHSTNQGILDIRQGNYGSAVKLLKTNSYNAALANILNGVYNITCNENTAECYYLNAIAGARSSNESLLFTNLEKAVNLSSSYKLEALNDLEFEDYKSNEQFLSIIK